MRLQADPLSGLLALAPSPMMRGLTQRQRDALGGNKRFRAWLAGRRAGKTYAAAVWLLGGKTGQTSAYCARSLKSAKAIMLGVFAELNARYGLNLEIRGSTGTIIEPNGHIIQFYGLRDMAQADLMRGTKFRRVFIDEGGTFGDELLKYSIESVIQPTLIDLRGEMVVAGTPGPIPKGYFYDITGNPGLESPFEGRWPTWHWTFEENPHVPRELVLEEALAVNGWEPHHATFRREYGGIWCEDAEALIYKYKGEQWAPPPQTGVTVMAIDFGVVDSTTWSIGRQGYETRPHVHIVEAKARDHIDLPEIASITRQLMEKWSVNRILADEGALGKALANNLRNQYRLPIEPARKAHKRARIDGARGRLYAGTLHICAEATPLYDEWVNLCWNDTRDDHHPRQADDISDATLYMLDAEEFSAWEFPVEPPVDISLQDAMRERAMARAMRGNNLGQI
jgi:hypothetical protein